MIAEPGSAAYKRSTCRSCRSPPWRLSDNRDRGFEAVRPGTTHRRTSSPRRAAQDAGTAARPDPLGTDRDRPVEEAKAAHQGPDRAAVLTESPIARSGSAGPRSNAQRCGGTSDWPWVSRHSHRVMSDTTPARPSGLTEEMIEKMRAIGLRLDRSGTFWHQGT